MDKLTKEEVLHVASLGKLELNDEEIERYSYDLKVLFNEIDKVNELNLDNYDNMISPSENKMVMFDDEVSEFENVSSLIENAPRKLENFIEVAGVFDE